MVEDIQYTGIWWSPQKPEQQITGTFKFSQRDGVLLELMGSFRDFLWSSFQCDILHGLSSSGKAITLYTCFEVNYRSGSRGFPTSTIRADVVFIGYHFAKPEDIVFRRLYIRPLYLEEWSGVSGIERKATKLWTIKYRRFEPVQLVSGEDYSISIVSSANNNYSDGKAIIEEKIGLKVEFESDRSFEGCLDIVNRLQDFLSLAVRDAVLPVELDGRSEQYKIKRGRKFHYEPIQILYRLIDMPIKKKKLVPYDLLFTLGDAQENIDEYLKNWLQKAELLKPIYSLYFGTLYNPRAYVQQRFLSLAQAVEVYHRVTMPNSEIPKLDHKQRVKVIVDAVPEDYKNWLKDKLAYSNEPTLRKRLNDIATSYDEVLGWLMNDKLIGKITYTRNYLTHYNPSLKDKAVSDVELYDLTVQLQLVLEVLLMKEIGFTFNDIKGLLSRNRTIQHLRKYSA